MAIRMRMSVHGRTNYRIFHINVVEGTRKRDAKPTELLGVYDPHVPEGSLENVKNVQWSVDRIRYWLSVGAKPSRPVLKLLELGGILQPGSPYHPKPQRSVKKPSTSSSPTLEAVKQAQASKESS